VEVSGPQPGEIPPAGVAKVVRLDHLGRKMWIVQASRLFDLTSVLDTISGPRTLLILNADAEWDVATASELAEIEITSGLRYLCAWGIRAGLLEEVFDNVFVDLHIHQHWPERPTLMTTSHHDEPWESALWFFVKCAEEAEGWPTQCEHRIVAVVGDRDIPKRVEDLIALDRWDAS
jgi:hypothetical protein